jgi:hypothetical protein
MTYDLRRLRLHGIIQRIPRSHRYRLTPMGLRTAIFFSRVYARLLRPGLSVLRGCAPPDNCRLHPAFAKIEREINQLCDEARLVA